MHAGALARYTEKNDLFMLDPSTNTWSDLTYNVYGQRPSARYAHGFASADNKLFVFGGQTSYNGESACGVERKACGSVVV